MEIIAEVFIALLQLVAEFVLQVLVEALAELGLRSLGEPFRRKPTHPVLAAVGYALLGGVMGGVSLWLMPGHFIEVEWLRMLNLFVTPLAAGAVMAGIGAWRRRNEQTPILLDRFGYGFIFAFAMSAVRFAWGN